MVRSENGGSAPETYLDVGNTARGQMGSSHLVETIGALFASAIAGKVSWTRHRLAHWGARGVFFFQRFHVCWLWRNLKFCRQVEGPTLCI